MRIGLHLSTAGTLDDFHAEAAAAHDLDAAWANLQPGGWDPLTLLPSVEGPAELGTAVVPTYPQHPAALATEALTAQALTGGRLTLGIGPSQEFAITGWWGIPYTKPASHTREYLEVLRPLLRGEHVKHSGEFFTVDYQLEVTAPEPQVLLAALGPRMLGIARDLADGTIAVWVRPDTIENYFVPRLGPGRRVVTVVMVGVTGDPDGVREQVARQMAIVRELPAYQTVLARGGLSGPADAAVVGDETTVVRELRRFRDAGVTDLIVIPVTERGPVLEAALQAR